MPWFEQQLIANGVSATGAVVVPKAILEAIINDHIATIAVNAGGTGYVVGEEFDIVGGTAVALNGANFVARGRVVTEVAGVVTAVELLSVGAYTVNPGTTGLATTNATLAGNDDLTVDVTIGAALWTQDRTDYVDLLTLFEWLATSTKVSNPPTIGFQSQGGAGNDGMRIVVATGFDNGATWLSQPGAPPTNRFYMAVPVSDPQIYLSITDRRVNVLVTDGTFKQYAGVGLFVPFVDVEANWPFPGIVHAQSTALRAFNEAYSQTLNAGIVNTGAWTGLGPYQYRNNIDTTWLGIENDNGIGADNDAVIWPNLDGGTSYDFNRAPVPAGSGASSNDMNPFGSSQRSGSFQDDDGSEGWFNSDSSGTPQGPAPLGIAAQLHFTMTAHIIRNQTDNAQLIGIIDGFEHIHGRGLDAFDEIESPEGRRYLAFQDTNATQLWRWVAMEKL